MLGKKEDNLSDKVIRYIFSEIDKGHIKKGDKLPTNRELLKILDVSILTVQRSLKHLEQLGVVACKRRSGTFLINPDAIFNPKIKSGIIGLFCPRCLNDFHMDLLDELEKNSMENGKLLSINFTYSDPERELMLFRTLARQKLEALVYIPSPLVVKSEKYNKTLGKWVKQYIKEGTSVYFADLCLDGFEERLVSTDNELAGKHLTESLIERGHQHIAYFGAIHLPTSHERLMGFRQAIKKANLKSKPEWEVDINIIDDDWQKEVYIKAQKLLETFPEVTGFVVDNEAGAIEVYRALSLLSRTLAPIEDSIASMYETDTPPFNALMWLKVPGKLMGKTLGNIIAENRSSSYLPGRILVPATKH